MRKLLKHIFVILLFTQCSPFGGLGAYAQLYPVQLTPVFNSPYSSKLSDYATSMDTKFRLLVNPTDIMLTYRQVRLKLIIQGSRFNIQSNDFIVGQRPVFITGGSFVTLTNADIGALFRLENLQGISAAQYATGLPEGMYNFCFEMYDFVTNQKIAQKSCAGLYLMLNDPPLLNTPQKNEQIVASDFPNIMFTWTPRQMNATNVSYKFELKQLLDPTLDPQFAFQMAPLLYEQTLFSTALMYNLSMPILTPGMRYAWRVKAISTTGLSENAIFKNDGYSEIYSFKYATNCAPPTFVLSQSQSPTSVKITWQGLPDHKKYHLQYKKQDVRNAQWFSTYTVNTQSLITNLEPGVTYQFRVGATCDPVREEDQSYTYSNINTFTTTTDNKGIAAYNCGIVPKIDLKNQTPLSNLIQSETFTAGDFPVTILELQGHGPYSGKGYIIVPYLADTKIAVDFNNITINTDYQLIGGVVETSYNPDWKNVVDLEDFTGEGQGGQIEREVPFEISDIVVDANGDILVNGKGGEQVTIPGGKDTVITDSTGKIYNVDKDGNGTNEPTARAEGGKSTAENTDGVDKNGQVTEFTAKGITIAFLNIEDPDKNKGSKYAFDVMPKGAPTALEKLYKRVGTVALPYKAVVNGSSDILQGIVSVTDSNIKLDSIVFKTENGGKVDAVRSDKTFRLTVKGKLTYAEEQILATIKQGDKWKVIGAFMLVHISPKEVNVALIPTDDTSKDKLDAIATKTQDIYSKVGVKINFTKEGLLKGFNDVVSGSSIQTDKNTITSTYSTEQQNINKLYQGKDNTYVLFITDKGSSSNLQGYMRLNGQFGYVFNSAIDKTPAHELGHGIFKLEHPFEQYNTTKSGTDLLMDDNKGTVLNHLDWKQINDPAFKIYSFQSQSSGQIASGFGIAPDWSFVTNGDETTVAYLELAEKGFLGGFKSGDKTYKWDVKAYVSDVNQKDVFKLSDNKPEINKTKILLFFDNDKPSTAHKYLRIVYNDELKKVVDSRDSAKLSDYIDKYITKDNFRRENENRTTYWGFVACEGCKYEEAGNGAEIDYANYLAGLGKLANKGYKEDVVNVNASENYLYDYSGVISEKEKLKILSQMKNISSETGLTTKIFITDSKTLPEKKKEVTGYLANLSGSQVALWIDFEANGNAIVKTVLGTGVNGSGNGDVNKFLAFLSKVIPKFDGTYTYFNPLTAILDGIASIVTKAKIPERFYNPEIKTKDYNPVLYYVNLADPLSGALLINDQALAQCNITITNSKLVGTSQINFAFKCGIWNGLVDQVKGLAEVAAIVSNLIDGGDRAAEMWEGIKKLGIFCTENTANEVCIWSLIKKSHTGQACQIAETVGYDVANVITIAISFTKVGKIAQISQVLESLDVVSQIMKGAGKLIKVTIKGTGAVAKFSFAVTKAFIKPGFKVAKGGVAYSMIVPVAIDLSENIDNAVNKARELLKKTPEQLEEKLTILTPEDINGNIIGEIVENGEKIQVVLNKNEDQLRKSASEIIENASETTLARLQKLGLAEGDIQKALEKIGNSTANSNKLVSILEKVSFKNDASKLKDFLADITASTDLQDFVKQGKDFSKEWLVLEAYPSLRKLSVHIDKISSILAKGHVSIDDLTTILTVNKGLGARATDLTNFLSDLDHFALYVDQGGFGSIISGLKAHWFNGAGADGANWVIAVLRKEGPEVFIPSKTNFEVSENILGNTRRYDAVVDDAVSIDGVKVAKYFEFKSYSKVPPTDFAKQLMNDLNNSKIKDLKQLEWLFDAAKNPSDFTTNLKNAIDNMDFTTVTDATIQKFEVPNRNALKTAIKNNFNNIFKLK